VQRREPQWPVSEPIHLGDVESGSPDGGAGVSVEVAAAPAARPYRGDQILEDAAQSAGGADVFEEP
jgi:hypothetical protein